MCSETSEALGTTWEHAQLKIQKFLKIRITLLFEHLDVLILVDKPQRATGAVLMTQGSVDKFAAITTFHIPHVSTLESYLPHRSKTIEVLLKLNLKLSCSCE